MALNPRGSRFLDSMKYEEFVKTTYEALMSQYAESVYLKKVYTGRKTGHQHEIDVSVELAVANMSILILIECKHYKNKVDISDLLEFAQRLDDIGAHKGVVVTTIGFQEGAVKVADAHRIALVTTIPQWHTVQHSVAFQEYTSENNKPNILEFSEAENKSQKEKESRKSPHTTIATVNSFINFHRQLDLPSAWNGIIEHLTYWAIRDSLNKKILRFNLECLICKRTIKDYYFSVCTNCFSSIDRVKFGNSIWYKCECKKMIHIANIDQWVAKCTCGRSFGHRKLSEMCAQKVQRLVKATLRRGKSD